jgi:lipid-A-disaccharide synthase
MPAASGERLAQCRDVLRHLGAEDEVELVRGRSREVMAAADVVVLASGTATLEAMLLERPMVIGYRLAPLSFALMKRLAVTPYVGLPNVLSGAPRVAELLQDALSAPALALEAEALLGAAGPAQVDALAPARASMECDFDVRVGEILGDLLCAP